MICTNCFEHEYKTSKTELRLTLDGREYTLHDLDCEACPGCGDISFTHEQSLEIDKRRVALEFGVKPILSPAQLKILRRILGMTLDEICDLLHIGRNSYGRWERGEVDITPSMNLLVHNLIEKIPDAAVNLLEGQQTAAIEKANASMTDSSLSFGQHLCSVIAKTRLLPEVVSTCIGIDQAELVKVLNDAVSPEEIPPEVTANIACYFQLPFETLSRQLKESLRIFQTNLSATAVHEGPVDYHENGVDQTTDKVINEKGRAQNHKQVCEQYLARVKVALETLEASKRRVCDGLSKEIADPKG